MKHKSAMKIKTLNKTNNEPKMHNLDAKKLLGLALVCTTVAACSNKVGPRQPSASFAPNYHLLRNPISIGQKVHKVELSFNEMGQLDSNGNTNLQHFLTKYHQEGGQALNAQIASGSNHDAIVNHVNNTLGKLGYGGMQVNIIPVKSSNPSFVQLSFQSSRVTAHAEGCDALTKPMVDNGGGNTHDYFGCATRNNLAAMVANPNDLVQPGKMGSVSTKRRMILLDTYETPTPAEPVELNDERVTLTSGE